MSEFLASPLRINTFDGSVGFGLGRWAQRMNGALLGCQNFARAPQRSHAIERGSTGLRV